MQKRAFFLRLLGALGLICIINFQGAPIVLAQPISKDVDAELEKIKAPPRDIKDILRVLEQAKPDQDTVDKLSLIHI